jgi:hypothetical protein
MATTTPNYGWAVPTSTDLVKDGATAIETLGDSIDASMFTALGTKKAGMVLLNTTSFSAVASQAITPVFSATYDSYRVIIDITLTTADGNLTFKMRSGATDNSANYYYGLNITDTIANTNSARTASGAGTSILIGTTDAVGTTNLTTVVMDITKPFSATYTGFAITGNSISTSNVIYGMAGGANHANTGSFDGFNIIASAGNISGKVYVYGYNL